MNYLEFKNWKNSHSAEMRNLDLASAEDIFIYTKFIAFNPLNFENKQILFAESLEETLGYIRHIFLYDILNISQACSIGNCINNLLYHVWADLLS